METNDMTECGVQVVSRPPNSMIRGKEKKKKKNSI